jgi:hypothetical protein
MSHRLCTHTYQLSKYTNSLPSDIPGSYVIQRLLDHLKEATFYSQKDLEALDKNLQDCRRYVERGRELYSPHLLTLLDARIKVCEETLAELKLNLSELTPELTLIWEKLVSILRSLAGCNCRSKVSKLRMGNFNPLNILLVP